MKLEMASKLFFVIFVALIDIFNHLEAFTFINPPVAIHVDWNQVQGYWMYATGKNSKITTVWNFIINRNNDLAGTVKSNHLNSDGSTSEIEGEIHFTNATITCYRQYFPAENMTYFTTFVPLKVVPRSYMIFLGYICPERPTKGSGTAARMFFVQLFRNHHELSNHFDETQQFRSNYYKQYEPGTLINC